MTLKKYVLNEGANFRKLPAGSIVELNERQARAFADLVTPLAVVRAEAKMAAALAAELDAAADTLPAPGEEGDGAPMEPAPTKPDGEEPVVLDVTDPVKPVVVEEPATAAEPNTRNARKTVKAIRKATSVAEVEAIGDSEAARDDEGRSTVLEAVDKRLAQLEQE